MLTPREKSPLPENFPRGGSNPRRCGQRAQTLPTELFRPPVVVVIVVIVVAAAAVVVVLAAAAAVVVLVVASAEVLVFKTRTVHLKITHWSFQCMKVYS